MSISVCERVELVCANCEHTFEANAWCVVDARERPDLRLLILSGRLNVVRCPLCGLESSIPVPLLYHDAAHQAVLLALPAGVRDEREIRALADPLVQALHQAVSPAARQPYLSNVQLAGSMSGLAAEIRSWGGAALAAGGPSEGDHPAAG